jgi:hypothetical protein
MVGYDVVDDLWIIRENSRIPGFRLSVVPRTYLNLSWLE